MGSNNFSIRDFILNGVEENIRYNERVNRGRTIVSVLAPSIKSHMEGFIKEAVQDTHFLFIRDHRKGKVCDLF